VAVLKAVVRIAAALWMATMSTALAQERTASEYEVKAAFLYNFVKLTQWPTNAFGATNSPIVIGVLGQDPFGPLLDKAVHNKSIARRKIVVKRYKHLDEAVMCHLLFVSSSEKDNVGLITTALARRPVLSVGDLDGFAEHGGIIQLIREGENVRFAINPSVAARAGLTISSDLLGLATIVHPLEKKGP
jgi:hypothetical protein